MTENVTNVNEAIQQLVTRLINLDDQLASLKAEHIEPLQADKVRLKREFKAEFDISGKALDIPYRLAKLMHESKLYEDEDEGAELRDNVRVCLDALQAGGQLLLFGEPVEAGYDDDDSGTYDADWDAAAPETKRIDAVSK